jgi:hypothetical protein
MKKKINDKSQKFQTGKNTPLLSLFLSALALSLFLFLCSALLCSALSSKHVCGIEVALARRGNVARISAERRPVNVAALDAGGREVQNNMGWMSDIGHRTSNRDLGEFVSHQTSVLKQIS